jgi:branched-chain amino acid transport system ATP-binding protein
MLILEIDKMHCGYGDFESVHGISFNVASGEIFALLGPNGAGKTSTIMALAGHARVFSGRITYQDADLTSIATARRVRHGIALAPEGRRLFPDLSVDENLEIGGYIHNKTDNEHSRGRILSLFPRLKERLSQLAGSLSGGEQQMLAIGRALMSRPKLLIIDELSLGLMPRIIDDIYAAIERLRSEGMTILLVEQNTKRALDISDSVCVLESGRVVWHGTSADARKDAGLVETYLGISG